MSLQKVVHLLNQYDISIERLFQLAYVGTLHLHAQHSDIIREAVFDADFLRAERELANLETLAAEAGAFFHLLHPDV